MSKLNHTQDKLASSDPNAEHDPNDSPTLKHKSSQNNSKTSSNKNLPLQTHNDHLSQNIPRSPEFKIREDNQVHSQNLNRQGKRQKLPSSLVQNLRKRALQSGQFKAKKSSQNMSKFGKAIISKIKKQEIQCGICLGNIEQKMMVRLCSCSHTFCKGCLKDYVTYKIKMYEQVICPQEKCDLLLNQNTQFFQKLPENLKKQYAKIHNFYVTLKDPNQRLCPRQNCEGIINLIEKQYPVCGTCKKEFCPKCYFEKHDGSCDQREVDFLQNNFHYRQCYRCKTVVERTEGCNHMTCKCNYEFCYVCGHKWNINHRQCYRRPDLNNGGQLNNVIQQEPRCCNETCRQCPSIEDFICRLALTFLFLWFIVLVLVFKITIVALFLGASLLAGIVFFPFDILCETAELGNYKKLAILIIFFPITILLGIYRGITEMFFDLARQQIVELWETITEECLRMWP